MTLLCLEKDSIAPYFVRTIDFIRESAHFKLNTLVHCKNGDSRSAALVAAFLIYRFKISTEKAVSVLQKKRPSVSINEELLQQLQESEEQLKAMQQ